MPESNTAIARRLEEAFESGDEDEIRAVCDTDLTDHNPLPEQKPGLAGYMETAAFYKSIFPDLTLEELIVIGEGDLVATRWTVAGTHQAEFFGIPPTGKRVRTEGMNFYRVTDGKVTDVWTQFDGLGLMEQLGAAPG